MRRYCRCYIPVYSGDLGEFRMTNLQTGAVHQRVTTSCKPLYSPFYHGRAKWVYDTCPQNNLIQTKIAVPGGGVSAGFPCRDTQGTDVVSVETMARVTHLLAGKGDFSSARVRVDTGDFVGVIHLFVDGKGKFDYAWFKLKHGQS